ncbi:hypothetical protein D3C78_1637890 [compost metagenome]
MRLGIVVGQALDLGEGGLLFGGRAGQHHVTQGDGAVVHAAAEVDRLALLDAVLLVDGDQAVSDHPHAIHADQSEHHHHRQDDGEAEGQALADAESSLGRGRHCGDPL